MSAALAMALSAAIVLGLVGEFRSLVNGDVAWYLLLAERVYGGAVLYRDLIEVNPPLVVWLNLPVVALARATGLDAVTTFRIAIAVVLLAGMWVTARALHRAAPLDRRLSWVTLLSLTFSVFVLPVMYFGEREHLIVALLSPYLAVTLAHLRDRPVERRLALAVGILGGVAVALKPHFAGIPLGALLYRTVAVRRARRWVHFEDRVALVVLGAYGLAVFALAPHYADLVDRLGAPYFAFARRPLAEIVAGDIRPLLAIGVLVLYGLQRASGRGSAWMDLVAVATAGALAGALVQQKGFGYHYLPAIAFGGTLAALMATAPGRVRGPIDPVARLGGALVIGCILWLFAPIVTERVVGRASATDAYTEAIRQLTPRVRGSAVAVLSSRLGDAFPLVTIAGARWVLRFPSLWFIAAGDLSPVDGSPDIAYTPLGAMSPYQRWCVLAVVDDLVRERPESIIVRQRTGAASTRLEFQIDYVRYLSADPRFVELLAGYRKAGGAPGFDVYERSSVARRQTS